MDVTRLLLTLFAGAAVLLGVALTVVWRRRQEERARYEADLGERLPALARALAAEELRRKDETIADLGAQLQAAGRGLRRLAALERAVEVRAEHASALEQIIARVRSRS